MANLLVNPTFGAQPYDPLPPGLSGLLPRGWKLAHYSTLYATNLIGQDQNWAEPEIVPVQWRAQFPEWQLVYGAYGIVSQAGVSELLPRGIDPWVLKVFKGHAPTSASFEQTVEAPAGMYRFTCPIFPDQKQGDGSRPSPDSSDDWYLASEVMTYVKNGNGVYTPWKDARYVPLGEYTPLVVDYYHSGGPLTVGFSVRGRWGFANNGWFIDECKLERIGDAEPAPPVTEPPSPTMDAIRSRAQSALSAAESAMLELQTAVDELQALNSLTDGGE